MDRACWSGEKKRGSKSLKTSRFAHLTIATVCMEANKCSRRRINVCRGCANIRRYPEPLHASNSLIFWQFKLSNSDKIYARQPHTSPILLLARRRDEFVWNLLKHYVFYTKIFSIISVSIWIGRFWSSSVARFYITFCVRLLEREREGKNLWKKIENCGKLTKYFGDCRL